MLLCVTGNYDTPASIHQIASLRVASFEHDNSQSVVTFDENAMNYGEPVHLID